MIGQGPVWAAYLDIPADSAGNYRAPNGSTSGGAIITLEGSGFSSPSRSEERRVGKECRL